MDEPDEEWKTILEFPNYQVSNYGRVANRNTLRILRQTKSPTTGLWWVGLMKNCVQYKRSVHRLVATTFLHEAPAEAVPVHWDGNLDNNHVSNLEWKSRSFARDLREQQIRGRPLDYRPVRNITTGEIFANTMEAADAIMGLEKYIQMAAMSDGTMSYMRARWEFLDD